MKTSTCVLVPFAACLLLASCDGSKHPLSDPLAAKPDARLAGIWRLQGGEGEVTYYHVGAAGGTLSSGVMRIVGVKHRKSGAVEPDGEFLTFPTFLSEHAYLNCVADMQQDHFRSLEEKGWKDVERYCFLKYKVEGDSILLWAWDRDAARCAVESGKVKGEVTYGEDRQGKKTLHNVVLTDTTDNLARFVASAGDGLFSKEALRLERVK